MNKLDRPMHDDDAAFDAVANNSKVGSYPQLQPHVTAVKAGYAQYLAVNGNVAMVTGVTLPTPVGEHLRGHYGKPPKALGHITTMREDSDSNTCPMCGSLHSGTLDHVMDKEHHPAFAVFAQNLVPACKCNSKRLKPLTGPNPGERILHPYFDGVLAERIVAARFTALGPVPHVETKIILNPAHPDLVAAGFHHDSVVMRTAVHGYLRNRWISFVRKPGVIISDLKRDPVDQADLAAIIEAERDRIDEMRKNKNNWDSVFLSGLLDDDVLDWLLMRFSLPGRAANGPLI